jgi:hypothetical protein
VIKYSRINDDGCTFTVLDSFSIEPPSPLWWQVEDIDSELSRGAVFRGYLKESSTERAQLVIVDVSDDPTEPLVGSMNETDVANLDRRLSTEIRAAVESQGQKLVRWMSSHLNETSVGGGLVTAYIKNDPLCGDRQVIDLRMTLGAKKMVLEGVFNVADANLLAAPVYKSLVEARVVLPLLRTPAGGKT